MNAKTRSKSTTLTSRLDVRELADLALWFTENGDRPRSQADLGKKIFESFYDLVVSNGLLKKQITSTEEALKVLESLGLDPIKASTRNLLLKQIKRESIQSLSPEEILDPVEMRAILGTIPDNLQKGEDDEHE